MESVGPTPSAVSAILTLLRAAASSAAPQLLRDRDCRHREPGRNSSTALEAPASDRTFPDRPGRGRLMWEKTAVEKRGGSSVDGWGKSHKYVYWDTVAEKSYNHSPHRSTLFTASRGAIRVPLGEREPPPDRLSSATCTTA